MKKALFAIVFVLGGLTLLAINPDPGLTRVDDIDDETCLMCHSDADMVGEEYVVDESHFENTPHEGVVSCVECHVQATEVEDIEDHGVLGAAKCSDCHELSCQEKQMGRHADKLEGVPTCGTCHGEGHAVKMIADEESPVNHMNQVETCGQCHQGEILENFKKSIHGHLVLKGDERGPTCGDCHGHHNSLKADILRNGEFKIVIAEKCGECHKDEMAEYHKSVHGQKLLDEGVIESASCADCHSSHKIAPPDNPDSPVHPLHIEDSCATCHGDETLTKRFGWRGDLVHTFDRTYHGQAKRLGDEKAANCGSCHTNHSVQPMDHPDSSVHPNHLLGTCQTCHKDANENFVSGKIHVDPGVVIHDNEGAHMARVIYIWIIVITIGAMVVHNIFDFIRKFKIKMDHTKSQPHVVRMNNLERFLHFTLAGSFILLAYTGFALVYPDVWWVAPITWMGKSEEFRMMLHRGCGVLLTLVAFHHLWFMFFHKRGIEQRKHFWPNKDDIRDLKDNVLFFMGKRKERPKFGRFSYMEKAEYWALVWGTGVMVVTGYALWFKEAFLTIFPKWLWEICLVVHLYEAILAVLAVFFWHFYHVMLNPDEAPVSETFISGRMPLDEMKLTHPREYERLLKEKDDGSGEIKQG